MAGLIAVDDAARPAAERGYRKPPAHVGVLVDPEHAAHVAPFAEMAAGIGGALEHVVEAYRTGHGVPYPAYGSAFVSGQGGTDERVAERFVAPGDIVERMMYGWSVVHCLPVAMAEQPSEAIGKAIRPDTVRRCARQAGYRRCEVLEIDNPLFRFYRLRA